MASLLNMSGGSLLMKALPYDAEVEYLESSGTQWIDTGYKPNANIKFEISGTQDTTDSALFGLSYVFYCFDNNNISDTTYYGFCGNTGNFALVMRGIPVVITMSASDGLVINGTKYANLTAGSTTANYSMALFGRRDNNNGVVLKLGRHIIKYTKIYSGNTLVLDLIPVRIGQIGYMYDKVSKQLFSNSGTGNFILGNDI